MRREMIGSQNKIKRILVVLLCAMTQASTGIASIPDRQRSIPLDEVAPVRPFDFDKSVAKEFFMDYFPVAQITPTSDRDKLSEQIQYGIVMKSVDKFFNGDFFKKTAVGQIAHEVKEAASQEVTVASSPSGVQHKVGFDLKALEKQAVLRYDGYLSTRVTYLADKRSTEIAFAKALGENTMLTLTNDSPVGEFIPGGNVKLTYNF